MPKHGIHWLVLYDYYGIHWLVLYDYYDIHD
jgi:hypothetical protein